MSASAGIGEGRGRVVEAQVVVPAVRRAAESIDVILERQGDRSHSVACLTNKNYLSTFIGIGERER